MHLLTFLQAFEPGPYLTSYVWCMVYGVWCVLWYGGVWYMVYAMVWCMVWCMVYGVWCAENERMQLLTFLQAFEPGPVCVCVVCMYSVYI